MAGTKTHWRVICDACGAESALISLVVADRVAEYLFGATADGGERIARAHANALGFRQCADDPYLHHCEVCRG